MGKGFIQKHTAKELQAKVDSHKNKGGGKEGQATRTPKCAMVCTLCKVSIASLKNMEEHYGSKHPKVAFDPNAYAQA